MRPGGAARPGPCRRRHVPEGLSPSEVGKEIAEHRERTRTAEEESRHDRRLSIIEALLLSLVAAFASSLGFTPAEGGSKTTAGPPPASGWRAKANPPAR